MDKNFFEGIDLKDYRPVPFWSWNNKLDEKELVKQIREMKKAGIGGFIMHARTGLITKYLSGEWFDCIGACLKEAKKLDMNAWVYDENGWPSGFVEGRLLENIEYRANYLEYQIKDNFDENAFAVYVYDGITAKRIDKGYKAEKYHCVYIRTSPANTDILNPVVVDEFIRLTYDGYYKRFPESFGKELKGFFTDEPQYFRYATPYTRIIDADYKKLYNEDVKDGLLYLFLKNENGYGFRYRYYSMLNNYYVNNYYKKLYDWCESHNCMLTGHSVEETCLFTQMWGGAAVMPTYEYEHIPGIDSLARHCGSELMPKQVSSVAQQLGKKQVLTETFGCSGYDVTPEELKSIGQWQYFNGVSLMCQHLLPYSISSQGKYDHPPVFSRHGNWWEEFKTFNNYFTKLGYIISNTEEITDVAVINPMKSVYLDYIRSGDYNSVKTLEDEFNGFLIKLRNNSVLYQLIDETILQRYGKAENGKLTVGKKSYGTVILPPIYTISKFTNDILGKFVQCGGRLYPEGKPKYLEGEKFGFALMQNISFEDILKSRHVKMQSLSGEVFITARKGESGEFLFIKNLSHEKGGSAFKKGLSKEYVSLDIETLEKGFISDEINLKPWGSQILYKEENSGAKKQTLTETDITKSFELTEISKNYLVIDSASISFDGESYGEVKNVQNISEALLRKNYRGLLFVKFSFVIDEMPESLSILVEKSHYIGIEINNNRIKLNKSNFDIFFCEAGILKYVRKGLNEIVYSINYYQHDGVSFALFDPQATESLRNCLYYDTEIENIYLTGDFTVNKDFSLSKRSKNPPLCGNLQEKGYPFFYGNVCYKGSFSYGGGETFMRLTGRFMVANVKINGKRTDYVLNNEKNITKYIKKGDNEIEITVKSSLRNLMGPHHYKPCKEPLAVSPYTFTLRGSRKDGESGAFTEEYNLVGFGLDKVIIKNIIYS